MMKTPNFVCSQDTPWEDWLSTIKTHKGDAFGISTFSGGIIYPISEVETQYPGFTRAYDNLVSIGCKSHCITIVLKFCILHANGVDLDKFLINSKTLSKVETSLSLGLSNAEISDSLANNVRGAQSRGLPDDLGFVAHA